MRSASPVNRGGAQVARIVKTPVDPGDFSPLVCSRGGILAYCKNIKYALRIPAVGGMRATVGWGSSAYCLARKMYRDSNPIIVEMPLLIVFLYNSIRGIPTVARLWDL